MREDDVLLQGATFVSAILFFYVNTLISDAYSKTILSMLIVFLTGSSYLSRAYAKIKSNPEYRFLSAFLLVWLVSSYVFEFLALLFPSIFPAILTLPLSVSALVIGGLAEIPILLTALAAVYFPRRYGARVRYSQS